MAEATTLLNKCFPLRPRHIGEFGFRMASAYLSEWRTSILEGRNQILAFPGVPSVLAQYSMMYSTNEPLVTVTLHRLLEYEQEIFDKQLLEKSSIDDIFGFLYSETRHGLECYTAWFDMWAAACSECQK
jgi:hypothetical protein